MRAVQTWAADSVEDRGFSSCSPGTSTSCHPIDTLDQRSFRAIVQDGVVQGRGAVDMNGGVAWMLMAIEKVRELGVRLSGERCSPSSSTRIGGTVRSPWSPGLSRRRRHHDGADRQQDRALVAASCGAAYSSTGSAAMPN